MVKGSQHVLNMTSRSVPSCLGLTGRKRSRFEALISCIQSSFETIDVILELLFERSTKTMRKSRKGLCTRNGEALMGCI